MSDINEALRNAVTAREEPDPSVAPIGHKRSRSHLASATPASALAGSTAPLKPAVGLDMAELEKAMAAERTRRGDKIRDSYKVATQLSEEAASRMAFHLLEYVMKDQLGGKHNAVTSASPSAAAAASSTRLQLVTERASLRAVAALEVSYVCADTSAMEGSCVATRKVLPAAAALVAYRKSLRPCNLSADLVGGVSAGLPPHSRQHWQRTVEAALRGETHAAEPDTARTSASAVAAEVGDVGETPVSAPMDLFASARLSAGRGAAQAGRDSEEKPHFSVADFLNASDSDDSDGDN